MKNKKGFTLIELLASMVILGIIMAVAVPNIIGILGRNKANAYIEDAKKLVSLAEYKYRSDSSVPRPANTNSCLIMTLDYLNSSEFDNAPNNGRYSTTRSFVVIMQKTDGGSKVNKYYVNLVEEMVKRTKDASGKETVTPTGDVRGLNIIESSSLNNPSNPSGLIKNNGQLISTDITSDTPSTSGFSSITGCTSITKVYR